jgi:DNA invertase Pin-like site-specific DNA recombinase
LGYDMVGEYVDRKSGRNGQRERAAFSRLFSDVKRRRLDLMVFWSLNRFSREGIRKTIGYLQRLDALGVRFRSHTKPYLNTDNELIFHIVLVVKPYYAQLEAVRISERTKAGLARARAQGRAIGRPDGFERCREDVARLRTEDISKREMCRRTGLSYNTLKKYLARLDAGAAASGNGDPGSVGSGASAAKAGRRA